MSLQFTQVSYPEPHLERTRQILEKYPEVRKLFGHEPLTFAITLAIVAAQIGVGALLVGEAWWVALIAAYLFGAVCNHALFVIIHDASHNLIFKKTTSNYWAGMIANLPIFWPMAIMFRRYHLIHHRYQGELDKDADLAGPMEAKIVGNSTIMKAFWLLGFFLIEGIVRPRRLKNVKLVDKWVIINNVVQIGFLTAMAVFVGWESIFYLFLSTMFGIGLHPLGARWIQEHYIFRKDQETYSYYGPANWFSLNVGYHNEHHDFMMIPWRNLPKLKATAPEFYDSLYSHQSYTKLLFRFLFDPELSLYSRAIRDEGINKKNILSSGRKSYAKERSIDKVNPEFAEDCTPDLSVSKDESVGVRQAPFSSSGPSSGPVVSP